MAQALVRAPAYSEYTISLAANETLRFNKTMTGVNIIDLSGDVTLSINDDTPSVIRAGIGFKMPPDPDNPLAIIPITSLTFQETAGATATLIIATTSGNIQDNRASFAGNQSVQNASAPNNELAVKTLTATELQVQTKSGTVLDVALDAADAGLAQTVTDLVAALQASSALRERWTDLQGASCHNETGSASETQIVSSGANTNGIIVKWAFGVAKNFSNNCYLAAGSNKILGWASAGSGSILQSVGDIKNVRIPAGVALNVRADSTAEMHVWYEVL